MVQERLECYLCGHDDLLKRKGRVRDNSDLFPLECANCGLVMLSSFSHISDQHYAEGHMHDEAKLSISEWLVESKQDDERRFEALKDSIRDKSVLDFGCGNGGFLERVMASASVCVGVELDERVGHFWGDRIKIYADLSRLEEKTFDVVTAFHVLEHLPDPRAVLKQLKSYMNRDSVLIIEVPNASDALLTLYDCTSFQEFSYWSNHLFLFTEENLGALTAQVGMGLISVEQVQRYPLANHLYWLSKGLPNGHSEWSFLGSDGLAREYESALGKNGVCDTIVARLQLK